MAARLSQVERLNQLQAAKLVRQSQEIDQLRAELDAMRRSVSPASSDEPSDEAEEAGTGSAGGTPTRSLREKVRTLRAERDNFQRQVLEMTKFLGDYGLTWVGDAESNGEEGGESTVADGSPALGGPSPASPGAETAPPGSGGGTGGSGGRSSSLAASPERSTSRQQTPAVLGVDLQAVASCVAGLNATVEKAGTRMVKERVGGAVRARLVADDALPLPLAFFRDGAKLGEAAFQAYDQPQTQQLLRDILDGYFPYALKEKYPDGVALRVVDRTGHDYDEWLREQAHSDAELADGGSRLLPPMGRAIRSSSSGVGRRLTAAAPEESQRPRAGEVQAVAAAKPIGAGNAGGRGASAPAGERAPRGEVSLLAPGREPAAPVVRLQVKFDGGQRVVLCMEPAHTVGELEGALQQWRAEQDVAASCAASPGARRLLLRTAFPPRTYTDRAQTLSGAGLAPSATLFAAEQACED